jgi:hypothetical protein
MAEKSGQKWTPKKRKKPRWENAFLAALRETGTTRRAADAAQVNRSAVYRHRETCDEFADEWDLALAEAASMLEDEAIRRARDGLVRYKFKRNGEPLLHPITGEPYYELEYSDVLLIFLLKGLLPGRYHVNAKEIKDLAERIKALESDFPPGVGPMGAAGPMGTGQPEKTG